MPALDVLKGQNPYQMSQVSTTPFKTSRPRGARARDAALARRSLDGLRRSLASPKQQSRASGLSRLLICPQPECPIRNAPACGGAMRSRIAIALMTAAVSAQLLLGQQPSENTTPPQPQATTPVFRTGVESVRFDAFVTDKNGNPVTDLSADDFEVRESGTPQTAQRRRFPADRGQRQAAGSQGSRSRRLLRGVPRGSEPESISSLLLEWPCARSPPLPAPGHPLIRDYQRTCQPRGSDLGAHEGLRRSIQDTIA